MPALAYDVGPASEYPDGFVEKVPFSADPAERVAAAAKRLLADWAGLRARGDEARRALRCYDRTPEASAARILAAVREWTEARMLHASAPIDPI